MASLSGGGDCSRSPRASHACCSPHAQPCWRVCLWTVEGREAKTCRREKEDDLMSVPKPRSSGRRTSRFIFVAVGCCLPLLALVAGWFLLPAWWQFRLSHEGMVAQGTVVAVEPLGCGKRSGVNC